MTTKSEFIEKLLEKHPQQRMELIEKVVNAIFDRITQSITDNQNTEIRGFGRWFSVQRAPKEARNPKTGDKVLVQKKRAPRFKCSKTLLEQLNQSTKVTPKE